MSAWKVDPQELLLQEARDRVEFIKSNHKNSCLTDCEYESDLVMPVDVLITHLIEHIEELEEQRKRWITVIRNCRSLVSVMASELMPYDSDSVDDHSEE